MAKLSLKRISAENYETRNGDYWVTRYMGVWTVGDKDHDTLTDFMTLSEAKEFIAEKVGA